MKTKSIARVFALALAAFRGKDHDFTKGSLSKAIFLLAVPMVFEMLMEAVFALGYVFYAFGMVLIQSFNGAGDTKTPTYINFVCFWLFQLPLAYFIALYLGWGPLGVMVAIVLSEILMTLLSAYYFRLGKWKTTKV